MSLRSDGVSPDLSALFKLKRTFHPPVIRNNSLQSEGQNNNRYPGCGLSTFNETVGEYGAEFETFTGDVNGVVWGGIQQYLQQNLYYEFKTISDAIGFSKSPYCL